jgi:electron transfer flavoprotein alpha subunit
MVARRVSVTSPEVRNRIIEAAAAGASRNEIARSLSINRDVVSSICQEEGIAFDATLTQAATDARRLSAEARQQYNDNLRLELETRYLEDAHQLRARVWAPMKYQTANGGMKVEWTAKLPTAQDQAALVRASDQALAAADRIMLQRSSMGGEQARGMLGDLMEQLKAVVGDSDN